MVSMRSRVTPKDTTHVLLPEQPTDHSALQPPLWGCQPSFFTQVPPALGTQTRRPSTSPATPGSLACHHATTPTPPHWKVKSLCQGSCSLGSSRATLPVGQPPATLEKEPCRGCAHCPSVRSGPRLQTFPLGSLKGFFSGFRVLFLPVPTPGLCINFPP